VRFILTTLAVATLGGSAHAESLFEAEVRLGYGLAMGSETDAMTAKKTSPLTITAIGSMEISDDPVISTYGGFAVETMSRNTFGLVGGLRVAVPGMPVRIAAGGVWVYAPASRWGATASVGSCRTRKALGLCGDVQLTSYIAGDAIEHGHSVTEIQAVFGMVFDLAGGTK
jgi:hypothetical protein